MFCENFLDLEKVFRSQKIISIYRCASQRDKILYFKNDIKKRSKKMHRAIILFNITVFLFFTSFMMIQPILPIYIYNKLKLDEKEVGLIIGSLGLTSLLVRLSFSLGLFPRNVVRGILIGLYLNAILNFWLLDK